MSNILPFERAFDATEMTVGEIRQTARTKGWPGVHIEMDNFLATGVLLVTRLTRREAFNE